MIRTQKVGVYLKPNPAATCVPCVTMAYLVESVMGSVIVSICQAAEAVSVAKMAIMDSVFMRQSIPKDGQVKKFNFYLLFLLHGLGQPDIMRAVNP